MPKSKPRTRPEDLADYRKCKLTLIPLRAHDDMDRGEAAAGKAPVHRNWRKRRVKHREVVDWMKGGGNAGVRLQQTDLVIDVDPRNFEPGDDPLARLAEDVGLDLSLCPTVITGSGGKHLYLKKPEDVSIVTTLTDYKGIDLKSFGFQVVAAGSLHRCGSTYDWDDLSPSLEDRPEAPRRLLMLARMPALGGDEGPGILDPETLEECLSQIDPTEYRDHDDWLELMMASHQATGGLGRQEFIDWSTSDAEYGDHAAVIGRRWDSLHREKGRTVTVRTLFGAVLSAGGKIPSDSADACGFSDLGEEGEEGSDPDQGPKTPLEMMNEKHVCLDDAGRFRVVTFKQDPQTKMRYLVRHTRFDFEALYANKYIVKTNDDGEDIRVPLAEWWLKHPKRREAQGLLLDPCQDHPGWLNLWQGWAVEPRQGSWSALEDLIEEILVSGRKESATFLKRWLAFAVQHADVPAEVAVVLRGPRGIGKGTLARAVGHVFGSHFMHITSNSMLTGRFNSFLRWTLFLFADEIEAAKTQSGIGKIQGLITEPRMAFEGKGKDVIMGMNLLKVFMSTNWDFAVATGKRDERRYFVEDCSDASMGDVRRFKAINKQLYKEGGLEAMLYDLLMTDLNDWHPRENIPQTKALLDQKLGSLSPVARWWQRCLEEGHLPTVSTEGDWEDGPILIPKQMLQESLLEYAKEYQLRSSKSLSTMLGKQLKDICPSVSDERIGIDAPGLRADSQGRIVCYKFPALKAARIAFEKAIGAQLDW